MIARSALCLFLLASTSQAFGQDNAHGHQGHGNQTAFSPTQSMPLEGGQSAFSAIAEIVAMLRADPDTDWDSVDIAALQEHLLDMDLLTLESQVDATALTNGALFSVTADGRALQAIQTMVVAHAPFLGQATGWDVTAGITDEGAQMRVVSGNDRDVAMIQALGFYGLMATDAHHQEHHLAIATGQLNH